MITTNLTIVNELGLHARAAAKLVEIASSFGSTVRIGRETNMADCKSIVGVMMLAASQGSVLRIEIDGQDEDLALTAISELIGRRFDERE